jgi:hypothetical protein
VIVTPSFVRSAKIRAVGRDLRDKMVHLYILRLWAYCEEQRTDSVPYDPNMVAEICEYLGDAETFMRVLLDRKVLDTLPEGGLQVHQWREYNSTLWRNWMNGPKHGRKPKNCAVWDNPAGTQEQPSGNPTGTHGGGDRIR